MAIGFMWLVWMFLGGVGSTIPGGAGFLVILLPLLGYGFRGFLR